MARNLLSRFRLSLSPLSLSLSRTPTVSDTQRPASVCVPPVIQDRLDQHP
jgi:hypothetical protein